MCGVGAGGAGLNTQGEMECGGDSLLTAHLSACVSPRSPWDLPVLCTWHCRGEAHENGCHEHKTAAVLT